MKKNTSRRPLRLARVLVRRRWRGRDRRVLLRVLRRRERILRRLLRRRLRLLLKKVFQKNVHQLFALFPWRLLA